MREVGFLVKEVESHIIITSIVQPPIWKDDGDEYTVYLHPTKILKRDIVKMQFLKYHETNRFLD